MNYPLYTINYPHQTKWITPIIKELAFSRPPYTKNGIFGTPLYKKHAVFQPLK